MPAFLLACVWEPTGAVLDHSLPILWRAQLRDLRIGTELSEESMKSLDGTGEGICP
jgi:hypothetical protein